MSGSIVALVPADAEMFTVDGGDPADELHVTVVYYPESPGEAAAGKLEEMATWGPAVDATVGATITFQPDEETGRRAVALLLDSADIIAVREVAVEQLREIALPDDRFAGYVPHLTVGYGETDEELDALQAQADAMIGTTVTFDRIGLWSGDDHADFVLTGGDGEAEGEEALTAAGTRRGVLARRLNRTVNQAREAVANAETSTKRGVAKRRLSKAIDARAAALAEYDMAEAVFADEQTEGSVVELMETGAAEADLAEALIGLVAVHGKLTNGGEIHAAYETAEENEDAAIGVTCENCVMFEGPGACTIVDEDIEPMGRCRFAVIPPGKVETDDAEPIEEFVGVPAFRPVLVDGRWTTVELEKKPTPGKRATPEEVKRMVDDWRKRQGRAASMKTAATFAFKPYMRNGRWIDGTAGSGGSTAVKEKSAASKARARGAKNAGDLTPEEKPAKKKAAAKPAPEKKSTWDGEVVPSRDAPYGRHADGRPLTRAGSKKKRSKPGDPLFGDDMPTIEAFGDVPDWASDIEYKVVESKDVLDRDVWSVSALEKKLWDIDAGKKLRKMDEQNESESMGPESVALARYVGAGYMGTNPRLREARDLSAPEPLDRVFESAGYTLEEDVVVFRGVNDAGAKMMQDLAGSTLQDFGYTSTSVNQNMARFVAEGMRSGVGRGAVMAIRVPKGTRVIGRYDEGEIILPRGGLLDLVAGRPDARQDGDEPGVELYVEWRVP